jgi:hypothetical protein
MSTLEALETILTLCIGAIVLALGIAVLRTRGD